MNYTKMPYSFDISLNLVVNCIFFVFSGICSVAEKIEKEPKPPKEPKEPKVKKEPKPKKEKADGYKQSKLTFSKKSVSLKRKKCNKKSC